MTADFYIKRGDTSPALTYRLADANHDPIDLTNADVRFQLGELNRRTGGREKVGETIVDAEPEIVNAENGLVRYHWDESDTAQDGLYGAEFRVTFDPGTEDERIETFPNSRFIEVEIHTDVPQSEA